MVTYSDSVTGSSREAVLVAQVRVGLVLRAELTLEACFWVRSVDVGVVLEVCLPSSSLQSPPSSARLASRWVGSGWRSQGPCGLLRGDGDARPDVTSDVASGVTLGCFGPTTGSRVNTCRSTEGKRVTHYIRYYIHYNNSSQFC